MEITVKVPEELAARAKSSGLTADEYIERLLCNIADLASRRRTELAPLREEFAADWEYFRATNLHLDNDEVDAWLAGIEQGQNPDLPELHA